MNWIRSFCMVFMRLHYPVSLPEDVAKALGIPLSNFTSCSSFLKCLAASKCTPTRLQRFMERSEAELAFKSAVRRERFPHNSLYSFYFKRAWLEFALHFDEKNRLRRLYMSHKDVNGGAPVEIVMVGQEIDAAAEKAPALV